jgi:hypothetical protein
MPDNETAYVSPVKNEHMTQEYATTPRGSFRIITASEREVPNLSLWFEYKEWLIVGDGTTAYAVARSNWRPPLLNQDHVRQANSASHFDAGTGIEEDARNALARFEREFPDDGLVDEQKEYLSQRGEQWRKFVLDHHNEQCRRRANFMPVTVCGPARYPGAKMAKRADKILASSAEFTEKSERFFANTKKRLYELLSLEEKIERIKSGKWARGETIPANDPNVVELLEAKITYLEGTLYRGMPAYTRRNAQAGIKSNRQRIAAIKAERESPTMSGWDFDGGRVVANQDANRLQVFFDDKRRDPVRSEAMNGEAFRWSRRNEAWQRQLTSNAVRAAKRALEKIASANYAPDKENDREAE